MRSTSSINSCVGSSVTWSRPTSSSDRGSTSSSRFVPSQLLYVHPGHLWRSIMYIVYQYWTVGNYTTSVLSQLLYMYMSTCRDVQVYICIVCTIYKIQEIGELWQCNKRVNTVEHYLDNQVHIYLCRITCTGIFFILQLSNISMIKTHHMNNVHISDLIMFLSYY